MQKTPVKTRVGSGDATRRPRDKLLFSMRSLEGYHGGLASLVVIHFLQHFLSIGLAFGL